MPKITISPEGKWTGEVSLEDIEFIIRRLFKRKTAFLDYRTSTAEEYYGKSNLKWVEVETRKGPFRAPYEVVVDYRNWPRDLSWGEVELTGDYQFPSELSEHKEVMIKLFTKRKLLGAKNNPCPRISKIEMLDSNVPKYHLQKAWYYDQVGTNLSLDYPFDSPKKVNEAKQFTVRGWDIVKSGNKLGNLPSLESSRLSNTIGVAVGITAQTKDGQTVFLRRKRSKNVAVYPNMWSLPFSFALNLESSEDNYFKSDLKNFIKFDLGHEEAQELGLEPADLGPLTPIAFCRDLIRGGKPQFFFEKHAKVTFEELRKKVRESTREREYKGKLMPIRYKEEVGSGFSPELVGFLLLKSKFL